MQQNMGWLTWASLFKIVLRAAIKWKERLQVCTGRSAPGFQALPILSWPSFDGWLRSTAFRSLLSDWERRSRFPPSGLTSSLTRCGGSFTKRYQSRIRAATGRSRNVKKSRGRSGTPHSPWIRDYCTERIGKVQSHLLLPATFNRCTNHVQSLYLRRQQSGTTFASAWYDGYFCGRDG